MRAGILILLFYDILFSKCLTKDSDHCENRVQIRAILLSCPINVCEEDDDLYKDRFPSEDKDKSKTDTKWKGTRSNEYPNEVTQCRKKLLITVRFQNEGKVPDDDEFIVVDHVYDPATEEKVRLLSPVIIKLRQEQMIQLYALQFQKVVNSNPREDVINKKNPKYKGCSTDLDNPTCGITMYDGKPIPFSEGFCCSCDPKMNMKREPLPISNPKPVGYIDPKLIFHKEYFKRRRRSPLILNPDLLEFNEMDKSDRFPLTFSDKQKNEVNEDESRNIMDEYMDSAVVEDDIQRTLSRATCPPPYFFEHDRDIVCKSEVIRGMPTKIGCSLSTLPPPTAPPQNGPKECNVSLTLPEGCVLSNKPGKKKKKGKKKKWKLKFKAHVTTKSHGNKEQTVINAKRSLPESQKLESRNILPNFFFEHDRHILIPEFAEKNRKACEEGAAAENNKYYSGRKNSLMRILPEVEMGPEKRDLNPPFSVQNHNSKYFTNQKSPQNRLMSNYPDSGFESVQDSMSSFGEQRDSPSQNLKGDLVSRNVGPYSEYYADRNKNLKGSSENKFVGYELPGCSSKKNLYKTPFFFENLQDRYMEKEPNAANKAKLYNLILKEKDLNSDHVFPFGRHGGSIVGAISVPNDSRGKTFVRNLMKKQRFDSQLPTAFPVSDLFHAYRFRAPHMSNVNSKEAGTSKSSDGSNDLEIEADEPVSIFKTEVKSPEVSSFFKTNVKNSEDMNESKKGSKAKSTLRDRLREHLRQLQKERERRKEQAREKAQMKLENLAKVKPKFQSNSRFWDWEKNHGDDNEEKVNINFERNRNKDIENDLGDKVESQSEEGDEGERFKDDSEESNQDDERLPYQEADAGQYEEHDPFLKQEEYEEEEPLDRDDEDEGLGADDGRDDNEEYSEDEYEYQDQNDDSILNAEDQGRVIEHITNKLLKTPMSKNHYRGERERLRELSRQKHTHHNSQPRKHGHHRLKNNMVQKNRYKKVPRQRIKAFDQDQKEFEAPDYYFYYPVNKKQRSKRYSDFNFMFEPARGFYTSDIEVLSPEDTFEDSKAMSGVIRTLDHCKVRRSSRSPQNHWKADGNVFSKKGKTGTFETKTSAEELLKVEADKARLRKSYLTAPMQPIELDKAIKGKRQITTRIQTRGGQDCDEKEVPFSTDSETDRDSTHCMRFSDMWYSVYVIKKPLLTQTVGLQIFEKHEVSDARKWSDLTKGNMIRLGTFLPKARDDLPSISMTFTPSGEKTTYKEYGSIDPDVYKLLIPSHISNPSAIGEHPEYEGGPSEYLLVSKDDITENGDECDKVGISFEAFARQPNRCYQTRGTCLKNQPIDMWRDDLQSRIQGNPGKYFVENFGTVPNSPIKSYTNLSGDFLALEYYGPYSSVLEIEVKSDFNALVRKGCAAQIPMVLVDSSYPKRTKITLMVINTGLTSSGFRPRLNDCSFGVDPSWCPLEGPLVTIPPQQRHDFKLDLTGILPMEKLTCTVEILNENRKKLASRRIVIQKLDRCICVFHCECVCLGYRKHFECHLLKSEDYIAAGYTSLPPIEKLASAGGYTTENFVWAAFVFFYVLLVLGAMKAIIGLFYRRIGIFGMRLVVGPKRIYEYYERKLKDLDVMYDDYGFPSHPENCQPVQIVNSSVQFLLNLFFFIVYPIKALWLLFIKCPCGKLIYSCCSPCCIRNEESADFECVQPLLEKSSCLIEKPSSIVATFIKSRCSTTESGTKLAYYCTRYEGDNDPLEEDDTQFVLQEMKRYKNK